MLRNKPFPVAAEIVLIGAMLVGFLLIMQRTFMWMYQLGLAIVVTATFLEIAVGNVPKEASFRRSVKFIALFLSIIVVVFTIGILLVPYLTNLGR